MDVSSLATRNSNNNNSNNDRLVSSAEGNAEARTNNSSSTSSDANLTNLPTCCIKCSSVAMENHKTKSKLDQLRLVMQQKKERREARKAKSAPYGVVASGGVVNKNPHQSTNHYNMGTSVSTSLPVVQSQGPASSSVQTTNTDSQDSSISLEMSSAETSMVDSGNGSGTGQASLLMNEESVVDAGAVVANTNVDGVGSGAEGSNGVSGEDQQQQQQPEEEEQKQQQQQSHLVEEVDTAA